MDHPPSSRVSYPSFARILADLAAAEVHHSTSIVDTQQEVAPPFGEALTTCTDELQQLAHRLVGHDHLPTHRPCFMAYLGERHELDHISRSTDQLCPTWPFQWAVDPSATGSPPPLSSRGISSSFRGGDWARRPPTVDRGAPSLGNRSMAASVFAARRPRCSVPAGLLDSDRSTPRPRPLGLARGTDREAEVGRFMRFVARERNR